MFLNIEDSEKQFPTFKISQFKALFASYKCANITFKKDNSQFRSLTKVSKKI